MTPRCFPLFTTKHHHAMNESIFLPISIRIEGKRILIIGGGRVGAHKAEILSRYTRSVEVVSKEFHENFSTLPFRLIQKSYAPTDLDGSFLVYICTENEQLNARIKADCEARGILASVCDNPSLCDFVSPAVHRQDHMTIAVGSDSRDVMHSIRVRNRIAQLAEEGKIFDTPEQEK